MTNAAWDVICNLTTKIWSKVKREGPRITSGRPFNFGLKVQKDEYTKFEFKIKAEMSEESALESINMILEFVRDTPSKSTYSSPIHVDYNDDKHQWEEIDIRSEILKKIELKKEYSGS